MIEVAHNLYWASVLVVALVLTASIIGPAVWSAGIDIKLWIGTATAFVVLTAALGARWNAVGHGPYLATYEAAGSYAWALLGIYLALSLRMPQFRSVPALALAPALLLLGFGVAGDSSRQFESPAMSTVWLWIHVAFAKLSLTSMVLGTVLAVDSVRATPATVIFASRSGLRTTRDPAFRCASLRLSENLVDAGFFMLALVIGSGAIWARTAWGAYWTWDPIESWALMTWLLFGAAIHARRMWDITPARWMQITVSATFASALLFIGLRTLSISPHWIYSG